MNPNTIISSHEPYNQVIEITPETAARWLEANENNRRLSWHYIKQLARDMKAGRFACTHQGIAFDIHGRLIDGQHRLWAILEADVPVRMRVFYNEPLQGMMYIDATHTRTAADRITISRKVGTVKADELTTLRAMLGGIAMTYQRRTLDEEIAAFERYWEAVHFVHEHLPGTRPAGITNCMTRAAVARAWYCITDNWLLERFCLVLRTGASVNEREHAVVMLRNQLLELRNHGTTRWVRQRQYALTSRALSAYAHGEQLTVLRAPNCDLFLLPEEVGGDAAA